MKKKNKSVKSVPWANAVGSLMNIQLCARSDIAFSIGILGR